MFVFIVLPAAGSISKKKSNDMLSDIVYKYELKNYIYTAIL